MEIYEPREDSELLATVVRKHARGRALDVGTGSGILAHAARDAGCTVTALEQNPKAVAKLKGAPFRVVRGHSMLSIRGRFDTIICNPPYLPNDEDEPDPALHGGPKGYEYILQIIADSTKKLSGDGQFLFLISTLTNPTLVEAALAEQGFEWVIVAREKLFMEELLVYRATFILGEPSVRIGVGWRSSVYALSNRIAVKVSTPARAHKEGVLLRAVNKLAIGPKLLRVEGNRVYMQRVLGERLDEWFAREQDLHVLTRTLVQCYALDCAGIRKQEMNRPGTNVLVTGNRRVVLLDFERSIFATRPSNVPQFASWVSARLDLDVREIARAYSAKPTRTNFLAIVAALGLPKPTVPSFRS